MEPREPLTTSLVQRASQTLVCGALGAVSLFITHVLNTTTVRHAERVAAAFDSRAPSQGIITVSNHVTSVDDPGAVAPLVPASWLLNPSRLRWTLCAADRCFTNPIVGGLLTAGRALPIERGRGPLQPGMDAVVRLLNNGDWVHMFPEGARQPFGPGLARMRPGVGRLVADAVPTPVVLPFYHRGIHNLMVGPLPLGAGHRVDIVVGKPVTGLPELIGSMRSAGSAERDIHVAIADRIGAALADLRAELEVELGPEATARGAIAAASAKRESGRSDTPRGTS